MKKKFKLKSKLLQVGRVGRGAYGVGCLWMHEVSVRYRVWINYKCTVLLSCGGLYSEYVMTLRINIFLHLNNVEYFDVNPWRSVFFLNQTFR